MYSATKFVVRAVTEGLRIEHKADNIRCTTVSRAEVATELPKGSSEAATRKALREFYTIAIPGDSIARAIAYAIGQPADVEIDDVVIRPTALHFYPETNHAPFLLVTAPVLRNFRHELCRRNVMKVLFISFVVGLGVGILYGLIRVKSPAPPIVALLGLLGMVLGEQLGTWVHTRNLKVSQAASTCLVGQRYDRPLQIQARDPEMQMATAPERLRS